MFGLLRWRCGVYTALASVESYVKTYTPVGKKRRSLVSLYFSFAFASYRAFTNC